jgi:hypothetical protein
VSRTVFDPRKPSAVPIEPFVDRLQCLSCGSYWWSKPEAPSGCPRCKPVRSVDAEGRGVTTFSVCLKVAP